MPNGVGARLTLDQRGLSGGPINLRGGRVEPDRTDAATNLTAFVLYLTLEQRILAVIFDSQHDCVGTLVEVERKALWSIEFLHDAPPTY